jgi:hypothetical protein
MEVRLLSSTIADQIAEYGPSPPERTTSIHAERPTLSEARATVPGMLLVATRPPVRVGDPLAFYEVAATVIPVLFVAIVYQARVIESLRPRAQWTGLQLLGVYFGSLISFAGGFDAFNVLANQHPTILARHAVSLTLYLLALILVAQPLMRAGQSVDALIWRPMRIRLMIRLRSVPPERQSEFRRSQGRVRLALIEHVRFQHFVVALAVLLAIAGTGAIYTT